MKSKHGLTNHLARIAELRDGFLCFIENDKVIATTPCQGGVKTVRQYPLAGLKSAWYHGIPVKLLKLELDEIRRGVFKDHARRSWDDYQ